MRFQDPSMPGRAACEVPGPQHWAVEVLQIELRQCRGSGRPEKRVSLSSSPLGGKKSKSLVLTKAWVGLTHCQASFCLISPWVMGPHCGHELTSIP